MITVADLRGARHPEAVIVTACWVDALGSNGYFPGPVKTLPVTWQVILTYNYRDLCCQSACLGFKDQNVHDSLPARLTELGAHASESRGACVCPPTIRRWQPAAPGPLEELWAAPPVDELTSRSCIWCRSGASVRLRHAGPTVTGRASARSACRPGRLAVRTGVMSCRRSMQSTRRLSVNWMDTRTMTT